MKNNNLKMGPTWGLLEELSRERLRQCRRNKLPQSRLESFSFTTMIIRLSLLVVVAACVSFGLSPVFQCGPTMNWPSLRPMTAGIGCSNLTATLRAGESGQRR